MQNSCHAHVGSPPPTNPGLPGLVRFILPEAGKPAAGWGRVGGGVADWRAEYEFWFHREPDFRQFQQG
jgi:hypothetical protein